MRLVSRGTWGARRPKSRTALTPSFGVTVHYEGPHLGEYDHASCPSKVRGIQAFHMDQRGWADIAYTAIICRHGYTFECRWTGVRTAANGTNPGNDGAYAVCLLIGVDDTLPGVMLGELIETIDYLNNDARVGQNVNGHRDWKATACPGDVAYRELPNIRAALAGRPATPPAPLPPPLVTTYPQETPPMKSYDVAIPTGADGTGFRDLTIDPTKVLGIVVNVADPDVGAPGAADGGTGVTGNAVPAKVGRCNHGGLTRVVVAEAPKSGTIGVTVWAVA